MQKPLNMGEMCNMINKSRNPNWIKDELILALDLYLRYNPISINSSHSEVIKLSEILNSLPIHQNKPDEKNFVTPMVCT